VHSWIVAKDGLAVAREADVELKAIRAVPEAKIEGGDGIFPRAASMQAKPGAAVSEQ